VKKPQFNATSTNLQVAFLPVGRYILTMSATEVIAEIKALPDNERDRVLSYLVADAELREDLQDSITLEARRHEPSRPLAEVLNDLGIKT